MQSYKYCIQNLHNIHNKTLIVSSYMTCHISYFRISNFSNLFHKSLLHTYRIARHLLTRMYDWYGTSVPKSIPNISDQVEKHSNIRTHHTHTHYRYRSYITNLLDVFINRSNLLMTPKYSSMRGKAGSHCLEDYRIGYRCSIKTACHYFIC